MEHEPIGLYLHIPFCESKCPYCDFFSMRANEETLDAYTDALCEKLRLLQETAPDLSADTLYFGGGTPALLGAKRLCRLLDSAAPYLTKNAEITLEANPGKPLFELFKAVAEKGVNRVSLGLQSASENELRFLGRTHSAADAARAVSDAHKAGISNVSLDLMLALPGQTEASLKTSVSFCREAGASHVSAYLLQIEPHTRFWQMRGTLSLPDADEAADLYLFTCEALEESGFLQYEISNFAQENRQSRHNLKYWDLRPYLGLGPSAHSFFGGKRFFYPRSLRQFLSGAAPCPEEDPQCPAGSFFEYAMLRLRLCEGLTEAGCNARFGHGIPELLRRRAARYVPAGLLNLDETRLSLTRLGFLVSNTLLEELLEPFFS